MNRRHFLHSATVLAAGASCLPAALAMPPATNFPMGYQLFSVRDAMSADPLATLRALVDLGYAHFEGYGYDAVKNQFYGMTPAGLQRQLADLGAPMTSSHFGFADFLNRPDEDLHAYVDQCLTAAEILDLKYLVWPISKPADRTLDGFKRMAHCLNLIGEQVIAAGRQFAFHNNGGEFTDLGGGVRGYDVVLAEAEAGLVKLQLDLYWLAHDSDYTPMQLIERQPGRFVMWHVKDMHPLSRDYTELGAGTIDYRNLMPDPGVSGLQYMYLEQGGNYADNSMASAAQNARYWQKKLARRLG